MIPILTVKNQESHFYKIEYIQNTEFKFKDILNDDMIKDKHLLGFILAKEIENECRIERSKSS